MACSLTLSSAHRRHATSGASPRSRTILAALSGDVEKLRSASSACSLAASSCVSSRCAASVCVLLYQ